MSMMALRRNPYRKCKIEEVVETPVAGQECKKSRRSCTIEVPPMRPAAKIQRVAQSLYYEAKDQFYHCNYFAMSLDNFPATTLEMPTGWDCSRIKKMHLELQLKDAQRMNSYIDWTSLFAQFPSLVHLRIVPSFHPRYYEWARLELEDWKRAHFIFRAFFRELLASIPEQLTWKLGQSMDPQEHMQLEGRAPVAKKVLWDMYSELGTRRGRCRETAQVIDFAQR
ncbi:uncharacterized protein N0V89_008778 [Didymosphaeria variabile]|uniref:Uncharacterized protein n=1 Tax=Didymosphaeria variabile TaxID=1932322 RepID=A0A9W8XHE0_9PLEO|nr:uncharacterized protein N0V89_008778 [Didymosphaeria variabile]KAJ4350157.1 hypothetical protein N0V89_008778 [Didymosphaeria variabile]